MLDFICLWVGRATIVALSVGMVFLIGYFLSYALRRPYFCIKHLLPKKWKTESEWEEMKEYFIKRNSLAPLKHFHKVFVFSRHGHFGKMHNTGTHAWWEPTNRFFVIK